MVVRQLAAFAAVAAVVLVPVTVTVLQVVSNRFAIATSMIILGKTPQHCTKTLLHNCCEVTWNELRSLLGVVDMLFQLRLFKMFSNVPPHSKVGRLNDQVLSSEERRSSGSQSSIRTECFSTSLTNLSYVLQEITA
eukprot:4336101-Amphidinium_carterae.1